MPVEPAGVLEVEFRDAHEAQAGLTETLADLAQTRGYGFMAAGDVAEVSPIDGVHLTADAQRAIGKRAAQMVKDMFAA